MSNLISIVIPSYNGANTLKNQLPPFIKYLSSLPYDFEIIIVNDGAQDGEKLAQIAKENNCVFINLDKNTGKGGAVKAGMLKAKGTYRIFTDADIPFEYNIIERMIYYLDFKEFDIVIGDRTLPSSSYFAEISPFRKIGSNIFTFFVGRFVTTGLYDTQCGIKGFSWKVVEDIFNLTQINSFAFDVEVLYIALKRNYDIKRLPVKLRNNEESTVKLLKHAPGMLLDIFFLKLYHLSGKYKKLNK